MAHIKLTGKKAEAKREEIRGFYKKHGIDYKISAGSKSKALAKKKEGKLEARSKKAGYYVHGHKNFGDVYEA